MKKKKIILSLFFSIMILLLLLSNTNKIIIKNNSNVTITNLMLTGDNNILLDEFALEAGENVVIKIDKNKHENMNLIYNGEYDAVQTSHIIGIYDKELDHIFMTRKIEIEGITDKGQLIIEIN